MPFGAPGDAGTLGPEIFRLAVEVCPSGMIVVSGDGTIRLVNGEVERLFGYRRDELLGQSIEILLPERSRNTHAKLRRGFAKHPETRHFGTGREFNGRHKDGSEFPIEVGLHPFRVGDEFMVVGAILDISERKRLERMQDEFVATVSHELRTPMTSIAASLGLLLAGTASSLPQPAAHLLEIAQVNCQRLVRMVNDILDLKKLDSGQVRFLFQRCDARTLLEKAIEANQGFADGCGVAIRLKAPRDSIDLYVDPDRFIQVMTNLLSNALKFSSPGGVVVVTLEKRGTDVRIAVRDHGPGIPAELRPRIFEAFAQADGGSRQKGGSGLGLGIARHIVTRMQGQISFDDAPDGGTIFRIDLPGADHVEPRQDESAAKAAHAPARSRG
jgi:PAS domain S-box-containing protein